MDKVRRLCSWRGPSGVEFDETPDGRVRQRVTKKERIPNPITFAEANRIHGPLVELTTRQRAFRRGYRLDGTPAFSVIREVDPGKFKEEEGQ